MSAGANVFSRDTAALMIGQNSSCLPGTNRRTNQWHEKAKMFWVPVILRQSLTPCKAWTDRTQISKYHQIPPATWCQATHMQMDRKPSGIRHANPHSEQTRLEIVTGRIWPTTFFRSLICCGNIYIHLHV